VPKEGLEPSHPKALAPKASVSTISPPGHIFLIYYIINCELNCNFELAVNELIEYIMAENKRFELLISFDIHTFQACALDHYANSPFVMN
jgi:hypothetical protein